ncbi:MULTISPECIES: alpha-glucosidase [Actinomycetaceae]|uniref:glycoside hydrolase family 13 protein n=1 Tax=Actinomycetaceae TaxID=2049 RepID=UPI000550C0DB|nr:MULTISPECIES: alpha-glucosidase [Actinomycetaceae]WLD79065.1 alpha-glucosidase [Schaalia sp. HMT-172]
MILHSDLLPTGRADADPWWMNAVLYQIYPRSFQDSDGDGVGDLQGIVRRLEYLAQLGVDIVWISPIYRSPQADNGYDISDYRDIDPLFGDLETFDALVARAHELGMHIVMDLVVNHTSVEHPWFVESATGPDSARRDWYYWRDPRPGAVPGTPGAEPSNWESFFGGSAWEYDPASGQYYLHLFAREQPDLNWENPEVRDAVYDMMNWWLDRGVDGFRVDAIDVISKRPGLPDGGPARAPFGVGHECFADGPRLHEFLQEMHERTFARHPGSFTVGEASNASPESALLFCDPDRREFNMLIQFEHVNLGQENGKFSPRTLADGELADVMSTWQKTLGERGWNALYLENHDQPRAVSRFGDPHGAWYESATALATAYFLQRGTPFIYQGQEIGMLGGHFTRPSDFRDIESLNYLSAHPGEGVSAGLAAISRDNGRTPMQWDSSPAAGFTSGTPWIDLPPSASSIHVERQLADASSVLAFYRALIDARHRVPALTSGSFRRVDAGDPGLFVYVRSSEGSEVLVMTNLTGRAITPRGVFLDEDLSPSRWDLYLGNVASPTDSSEAEAGDPLPSSTMAPWEARVYLR